MDLACLQGCELGHAVGDVDDFDAIQVGNPLDPVVLELVKRDGDTGLVLLELPGTRAHRVGISPAFLVGLKGGGRDHEAQVRPKVAQHQVGPHLEVHLDRVVVDHLNRLYRGELGPTGAHGPLQVPLDRLRVKGRAVVEGDPLPQVEGVGRLVIGQIPAFGQDAGHGAGLVLVGLDQFLQGQLAIVVVGVADVQGIAKAPRRTEVVVAKDPAILGIIRAGLGSLGRLRLGGLGRLGLGSRGRLGGRFGWRRLFSATTRGQDHAQYHEQG